MFEQSCYFRIINQLKNLDCFPGSSPNYSHKRIVHFFFEICCAITLLGFRLTYAFSERNCPVKFIHGLEKQLLEKSWKILFVSNLLHHALNYYLLGKFGNNCYMLNHSSLNKTHILEILPLGTNIVKNENLVKIWLFILKGSELW